jgi:hypothetical protein
MCPLKRIVVSKYTPLGEFLRAQRGHEVPMTFDDIERLTGTKLPASARYRAWWSNNSSNSVLTKVWLDAGFESAQVDMAARKLVFRRTRGAGASKQIEPSTKRHPLFGALNGLLRVARGTDLTQPADPKWGRQS